MLLLLAAANAAGLPWECPDLTAPPDAPQFRTDAGLGDTFDALRDLAEAWIEDDCAWSEVLLDSGAIEASCVTSAGAFVTVTTRDVAESGAYYPTDYDESHSWSLSVELPAFADTWTTLALDRDSSSSTSGHASGSDGTREARWTGAVLDLPDDSTFRVSTHHACFGECDQTMWVTTPECAWSWGSTGGDGALWVEAGGHSAKVYTYWMQCGAYPRQAYYDDALYGHVDLATWELDEADRDGWSEAMGDCDDADPAIYPCAREIAADGIDQDCDGADTFDADGDGWEYTVDCDDASTRFYPGADDPAGDGLDQDCDGADDIDADGDGFSTDGDDRPLDCDDTEGTINPYRTETRCDGIDQNCDGVDRCDDTGPDDSGAGDTASPDDTAPEYFAEPPSAEAADGGGCRGGAAWLLLGGLAFGRRRRAQAR